MLSLIEKSLGAVIIFEFLKFVVDPFSYLSGKKSKAQ